ncbi:MAG: manganese efflux pump [Bacilli bacterium]|nr:manganese efflux pump [Bacilli bacterium]
MNLLLIITAVSLSMDAFSLSLLYGTLGMKKKDKFILSFIVGIFHFVMPLLGRLFGNFLFNFIDIDPDLIVCIILFFIGFQMILSSFGETEEVHLMKFSEYFLFSFAVSIDSFSVGISFTNMGFNVLLSSFVFSFFSFAFTFVGLLIGNKIEKLVGRLSTIIGGFILIIVGVSFIV